MSLVARHLEAAGIPTIVIGSGRDIVEQCGVARLLFVDYPLGNPCGKPGDVDDQRRIVGLALDVLEGAFAARTTVQAPAVWSDDNGWRDDYMAVTAENAAELLAAGAARRRDQAAAKLARARGG
ncbi:MAG: hypothetical protein AAGA93_14375 [Actinomycetota bacterium]